MMTLARKRFETHLSPVMDAAYRMGLHLSGNPDDAADLVQESALRACRSFHTFSEGTNFKAWFFRIITNLHFEWLRKKRRENNAGTDLELYMKHGIHVDLSSGYELNTPPTVLEYLDIDQVHQAIYALPDEFRLVSSLYFIEDRSYQEIADRLRCPIGTVRSRLHRSRKILKKALRSMAEHQGVITAVCA